MPNRLRWTSCILFGALLWGCGDDSVTALEGAYSIETWTHNSTGCDVEGTSVLETEDDKFAFVRHQEFFGQDLVSAGTCPTQAECEEEAFVGDDELRISLSGFSFEQGSDSAGWEGEVSATSWSGDSDCSGTVRSNRMTWDGMTLTIRREERSVTFPQSGDPDDECPTETAVQMARSAPCESLEVITATPL